MKVGQNTETKEEMCCSLFIGIANTRRCKLDETPCKDLCVGCQRVLTPLQPNIFKKTCQL